MASEQNAPLAKRRTDWAEDRTILASERTFGGWMRTGLSAVAVGLGVNAIFGKSDPTWPAKVVSTIFVLVGVFIFWLAASAAHRVAERLDAHAVQSVLRRHLSTISLMLSVAAVLLCVVLWTL